MDSKLIKKMAKDLEAINVKLKMIFGEIFELSSDYNAEYLAKPIGELIGWTKCGCGGTGLQMTQNGEDDVNQDICDNCSGQGWIKP